MDDEEARKKLIRQKQREALESSDSDETDDEIENNQENESDEESDDDIGPITHGRRPGMGIGKKMIGKRMPDREESTKDLARQFLDNEVAVSDSDGEEYSDDDQDDQDLVDDEQKEADAMAQSLDDHRKLDEIRRNEDKNDTIQKLMEKYVTPDNNSEINSDMYSISTAPTGSEFRFGAGHKPTRTEMIAGMEQHNPTIEDPNIWYVKCRIGEEKNLCMLLLKKAVKMAEQGSPLQIKSVISPDYLKGYICIEAYKKAHMMSAIDDISALRPGVYNNHLIKKTELTDIFKVGAASIRQELKEGSWVRPKRNLYKDDLAKVDYVDNTMNSVTIKLIPRIDYTRLRGQLKDRNASRGFKSKGRPNMKHFDEETIRSIGGEVTTDGDFKIFEGKRYRGGFLYLDQKLDAIQTEDVQPTRTELERFEDNLENLTITETGEKELKEQRLMVGDFVIVIEGELINLQGKILSVDYTARKATMLPKHEALNEVLEFPLSELKKHFKNGDHVKVTHGKYIGDTGMVVKVIVEPNKPTQAVVISDINNDEMLVLTKDLKICKDISSGVDSIGRFSFGDLVEIDTNQVGVIVRLEKDYLHVLNQYGKEQKFKHAAISRRKQMGRAMALDKDRNALQIKEKVKVIDGAHKGREATIKHIFRQYLFLYQKKHHEHGGIFVVRSKHCQLVGGGRVVLGDTATFPGIIMSPRHWSSPSHPSQQSTITPTGQSPSIQGGVMHSKFGPKSPGVAQRNAMIHKAARIIAGPYKGHTGIIKDVTATSVRIELYASVQTINVESSRVQVVDKDGKTKSSTGNTSVYNPNSYAKTPVANDGSKTPIYKAGMGGQTPMYEAGKTPNAYEAHQTPMYDGAMTPRADGGQSVWDANITNTPKPDDHDDAFDNNLGPRTPGAIGGGVYEPSPAPSPLGIGGQPHTPGYSGEQGYQPAHFWGLEVIIKISILFTFILHKKLKNFFFILLPLKDSTRLLFHQCPEVLSPLHLPWLWEALLNHQQAIQPARVPMVTWLVHTWPTSMELPQVPCPSDSLPIIIQRNLHFQRSPIPLVLMEIRPLATILPLQAP